MSAISTSVGLERAARAVGYSIEVGNFAPSTPNLPQRIAILGAANADKQVGLDTDPTLLLSAAKAGEKYGYGSIIHQVMRILKPLSGEGVGGIPIYAYPQADAGGATQTVINFSATVSTGASANETHFVSVNGRTSVDGQYYQVDIAKDDTALLIANKIRDAINGVFGAPCTATVETGTPGSEFVVITSKVAGAVSAELTVEMVVGDNNAEVTYAEDSKTAGTGAHDVSTALALFGTEWNTLVINPYGTTIHSTLEDTNGNPNDKDGLFSGTVFKPFMAIWGSTLSTVSGLTAITDVAGRKTETTNVLAPAPNSKGFTWEAAANVCRLMAINAQNTPHKDISGQAYPDMPLPLDGDIGEMNSYDNRDSLNKAGCSTVIKSGGAYVVDDILTTYHPDGEVVPAYKYSRDLMVDFNVAFSDKLLVEEDIKDKTIIGSDQVVGVGDTIKPVDAVQLTRSLIDDLANRALIVEPQFAKDSVVVQVSDTNPKRLERTYSYKRSSTAKIVSTTVTAGFAFGLE